MLFICVSVCVRVVCVYHHINFKNCDLFSLMMDSLGTLSFDVRERREGERITFEKQYQGS